MKFIKSLLSLLLQGIFFIFLFIIYVLLAVHVIVNKIISFPIGMFTYLNKQLTKAITYLKG